jgi:hypothetical protein
MRGSLVTLASASRLFLGSHLGIGTSNITTGEGTLVSLTVQVVEILVHEVHNISSQGKIVYLGVQVCDLTCKLTGK